MPDFHSLLAGTDLDFLFRVSRFWGVDLPLNSFSEALGALEKRLAEPELAHEVIQSLPQEALAAFEAVLNQNGRMTSVQFSRQFGEIRIFGEAKRKREQPDLHPTSPAEMVWYRALIGRGFFAAGQEPQEYIYIPDELANIFTDHQKESQPFTLRPAAEADHACVSPASGVLLNQLTTLLAELRKGSPPPDLKQDPRPLRLAFQVKLLESTGLIHADHQVDPEKIREVLESPRGEALLCFYRHWLQSETINDLRMLPQLAFEGNWTNSPVLPRNMLVGILAGLSSSLWWSIPSLIAEIKTKRPDFQRPAGDYDSWFIRREENNQYLRGFEAWDEVEGYLIRYLISGPLHWLGLLDLGSSTKGKAASCFKLSPLAHSLLTLNTPELAQPPSAEIKIISDGHIHLPAGISPPFHYQVARFCQLEKETPHGTVYVISSTSLKNAEDQGLKPNQLLGLLKHADVSSIPPAFVNLLGRFEKYGTEVELEKTTLLRVSQPQILTALQKEARAARCLGETLSPLIVKVKPGCESTLVKILAESGFLAETHLDV